MSARGAEFALKQTLDRFTHQGPRDGMNIAYAHGRAATFGGLVLLIMIQTCLLHIQTGL